MNDQTPSKTDTGFFTDGDDLTDFLQDQRLADTTAISSFDAAQAIVATFDEGRGDGAWTSLDRATVAARLATLIQPSAAGDAGAGYRSLDQAQLNLCGPAALLMMAMGRDPVAVARYTTELFETGSGAIGEFQVTAGDELRGANFTALAANGRIASHAE